VGHAVAVVGLGRVGLPLALVFARTGFRVNGIDISEDLLARLLRKEMPFREEGAQELLEQMVGVYFFPSRDISRIQGCEAIILTLGTPVDEHMNPVLSQVESVVKQIIPYLRSGQLIALRSTVSPGTTEYLGRIIAKHTRLRIGADIFLAFCPERIAEGHSLEEIPEVPQIVGGVDPASTQRATALFQQITKSVLPADARSVELAKLYCNMYRYIDFAIANEFMMIAHQHDRDIYEIIHLVNSGYKRGGLKQPGFTGGPCLYKDGFFLVSKTPFNELISCAWKINETVPAYLIEQIKKVKRIEGSKVSILGLAFKKDIDDTRNSLSFKARKIFHAEGGDVHVHDPFVPSEPLEQVLEQADIILLAMNHSCYQTLWPERLKTFAKKDAVVCDIWNLCGTGKIIFSLADQRKQSSCN